MKKILLATVATIPLLAVGMLPGGAQEINKQRGESGMSQPQGPAGAQEKRGQAQGTQSREQSRTSGQAESGSKVTQSAQEKIAQEKGAQTRTEGRPAEQAKGRSADQEKQAQGQAKSKQDESKTTGQAEEQNKGKSGQNQKPTRGAQNQKQNQKEPVQTSGQANQPDKAQANQPDKARSPSERTEQDKSREQNTQRGQNTQQNARGENRGNEAGGRVTLSEEQRTRVDKEVLSGRDVPRVDRVDFSVNVGVAVPERVRVVAVPSVLIDIHPEWRGDEYFVANDEIIIVDHSRRIIAMVPVRSSSASIETRSTTVGSGGEADIREVQQVLIEQGFYHGRVDGVMGRETMDALILFQRREGLEATGRIDERTTAALHVSGRTEGRGNAEEGRDRFDQRQGQSEPNKAGQSTSGQAGKDNDTGKTAQDRNKPEQTGRPSTSGQASPADNKGSPQQDRGAQDKGAQDKEGQNKSPSTSGQGGTQGQGQSMRPQNQPAPSGNGASDQQRKPGEK